MFLQLKIHRMDAKENRGKERLRFKLFWFKKNLFLKYTG